MRWKRSVIFPCSVNGLPLRSSQTPSFLKPLEWPSRSSRVLRQSRRAPVPPHLREGAAAKGDTGENLVELLERRLHCTISHMTFLPTPFAARQFVNHGHVLVNGKRVNIPSYTLRRRHGRAQEKVQAVR